MPCTQQAPNLSNFVKKSITVACRTIECEIIEVVLYYLNEATSFYTQTPQKSFQFNLIHNSSQDSLKGELRPSIFARNLMEIPISCR